MYIAIPMPRNEPTCCAGLCSFHTPSNGHTGGPKIASIATVGEPDVGNCSVATTVARISWFSRSNPPEKLPT